MPRYFFHVIDGRAVPDLVGTELPNVYAAHSEAVRFAGGVLADLGGRFWDHPDWQLQVCDEGGLQLFTLGIFGEESGVPGSEPSPPPS